MFKNLQLLCQPRTRMEVTAECIQSQPLMLNCEIWLDKFPNRAIEYWGAFGMWDSPSGMPRGGTDCAIRQALQLIAA